jgi:hypothetical protein
MLRYRHLLWVAAVPLFAVQGLLASNVQVGTCKPHLASFSTISAAVKSVPPGSTIQVCPGTYAEQITIAQRLTLEGADAGTADQVLITVPSSGLLPNTTSMFGEAVAAQILVQGAEGVKINNLAVDGTGGDMSCLGNVWIAGIFYGSGSSGSVSRVRASGQVNATCGVGIWVENSDTETQSVSIEDSSVYNVDSAGIFAGSGPTPTLSVAVAGNVVNASAAVADIDADSVSGQVRNNDVSSAVFGVFDASPTVSVASNTILATTFGVFLGNGGTAAGNHISASNIGVLLGASGATVRGNRLVSSTTAGVMLGCFTASVSGNFINDAPVGLAEAPSGSIGSNSFTNTATTITNGCATAAVGSLARRANSLQRLQAPATNLQQQWHTPATPFGTRTK